MGGEEQRQAALHARPRERRLGARGRLRGHQRGLRRHRHPASHPDVRTVPGLPGGRRHALLEQHVPGHQHRRRAWPSTCSPARGPAYRSSRRRSPADVAALADAGLTAYHAVRKALPLLYPGTTCVVVGAGGLGHIGIQCLAALSSTRIIVVDRNPAALALAEELGADDDRGRRRQPGRRGAGADGRGRCRGRHRLRRRAGGRARRAADAAARRVRTS